MENNLLIENLKSEHIIKYCNDDLKEILEGEGIDFIKRLMKYAGMQLYIPSLRSNDLLLQDIVRIYYKEMNLQKLVEITNFSRQKINKIIKQLEDESNLS